MLRRVVVGVGVVLALGLLSGPGQAQLKKLRTGTTIGELKSIGTAKNKRDTIIEVLSPGEEKPRRYTVGAQQKELAAAVRAAQPGQRVEIDWFDTVEGLCVERFRVLAKK